MNKFFKLTSIIFAAFLLMGCVSSSLFSPPYAEQNKLADVEQLTGQGLENAFWNSLEQQCGSVFKGKSSFPNSPDDSFYGKTLVADFTSCKPTEIRVPFTVGENKSRTWIFTKLSNGKVQLKHQHLHDDGSVDEVSNYGGISMGGEIDELSKTIHVNFPADDFTKQLLPEASTNVWTIEMSTNLDSGEAGLGYYLYRHEKKRFLAYLVKTD